MRRLIFVLAGLATVGPASAHDFWLQPRDFRVSPGASVSATLQVGHGSFRQRSPIPAGRITSLRSIGPKGVVDQRSGLHVGGPEEDAELQFSEGGTHVVVLETDDTTSSLPATRFNDYLKAEGLSPAIRRREQTDTADKPGRELYSRRAKSIVQVGPLDSGSRTQVTEPVGLTLEIVTERNPYLLKPAESLPVRVIYDGQPLPGALLKLTDLDADDRPLESQVTDSAGRAEFTFPHRGSWLLNVVWTKPIFANRTADYITTFSSLSFGYPSQAQ